MRKNSVTAYAILSLAILAILLTTLMLPEVKATWGEYPPVNHKWPQDQACRCDHDAVEGALNYSDDTWTALGMAINYSQVAPKADYIFGNWSWERGYGGGGTYANYNTTGPMICTYAHDVYFTTFYNYSIPVYGTGYKGEYPAYYQDATTVLTSWNPSCAPTVQGTTESYFFDPNNQSNQWYIESPISMTGTYP